MNREHYLSATPWEPVVGYSRAIKVGAHIHVSGTTATNAEGIIVGENDAYVQTIQSLKNIQDALEALGADLHDVIRTRMYVTNIGLWEEFARAHGEYFQDIRPATTMVEVSKLIDPKMLIEIEAEAISDPSSHSANTSGDGD